MEKGFLVFDFALSGPVWKGDRYALFGFLENEAEDYVYLTCRLVGGRPIGRGICMDFFRGYFTRQVMVVQMLRFSFEFWFSRYSKNLKISELDIS